MGTRALVVGLDGATWDVIEAHAARLPNLWRMRQQGLWARLDSTTPPMTLPAWSSVLTGCRPGRHGFFDFTRREPGTHELAFLDARCRAVPTLHRLLSDAGRRVASIAVPTTYPPEELDGIVIAGFDSPVATRAESRHCAPAREWPSLRRTFGGLRFADFPERGIGPGWHARALDSLLREIARKEALCLHLLAREPWELFMVVFGESDTAAHHFWMFHDPRSPRHAAARRLPGADVLRGALLRVYERLDEALGRLSANAELVAVVSDHGFGGANDTALYLNRFLEAEGWLAFRPERGAERRGDLLHAAALSIPGAERVVRRLPSTWVSRAETRARYGPIDFARTRAWSDEMNYAATVHLGIRGRDPGGTIENVPLAIADLSRRLATWRADGQPVVRAVHVDPYEGAAGAPDLVVDLACTPGADGTGAYSYTLLPSTRVARGTTWRKLDPDEHVGGKGLGMNGAHRQHGVLAITGARVPAGEVDASVVDVAPTLLHALGHSVPGHMQGQVLGLPVARAPGEPSVAASSPLQRGAGDTARSASDARRLRSRLRDLGYL